MIRKLLLIALLLGLGVLGILGFMTWAAFSVPEFYEQSLTLNVTPELRKEEAKKLIETTKHLVQEVKTTPQWSERMTQLQINSWIVEFLEQEESKHLPKGVSQPRVQLLENRVRIGFRCQHKDLNGIISLDLQPVLLNSQEIAWQIRRAKLGLLPLPLEKVIQQVSEHVKKKHVNLRWELDGESPTVILSWKDRADASKDFHLDTIELTEETLRLTGSRHDQKAEIHFEEKSKSIDRSASE